MPHMELFDDRDLCRTFYYSWLNYSIKNYDEHEYWMHHFFEQSNGNRLYLIVS